MSKPGRNDPCHCGSGKKYKRCCMSKDEEKILEKIKEIKPSEELWEAEYDENIEWPEIVEAEAGLEEEVGDGDDDDYIPSGKGDDEGISSEMDSPYPVISKEEEKIVNEWWDAYKKMGDNPDKIRRHLQKFMDKHSPEMVENLGIEHEVLFELGADYYRSDRHEEYIQLLKDIRTKYPGVYKRSAAFYDADIIAWLIANKQYDDIYNYLDYFKKFPVDFVDEMFGVINLLQATNNVQPVIDLIKKVHHKVTTSREVFGGQAIIIPLMTHIMSRYFHFGFTGTELAQMVKELKEEFNDEVEDTDFWKARFAQVFRPFTTWDESIPSKKSQIEEKYVEISFNYMRYLREHKNISWVSAHFYSQLMLKYFYEYLDLNKNKPESLFNFKMELIDKIGGKLTGSFIFTDLVKATILNSIWYFQEYLCLCGNVGEPQKKIIQGGCAGLYDDFYSLWRKRDIEALCFPQFPFWK